jgi:hypothetical protein
MYRDSDLDQHFFSSFTDEMQKLSTGAPHVDANTAEKGVEVAKKLFTKRDMLMAAGGAGTAYAANRAVKDIAAGEQMRKQQSQGY